MRGGAARVPAFAVVVLLTASSAALAARTDQIVLTNGDHLTGEVVGLRQGKLKVKTDDAGTLSIEWDKIASLTTAERYDLTTRAGLRLFGRLRPGPPGNMVIAAEDGREANVPMGDVVSFDAIKARFFQRIDGSFDLGGSYTQSSGVAQLSLATDATYRRPAYAYAASLSMNFTRQPESPDSSRYVLQTAYTRFRENQWFLNALGLFEGNEDLGFTFRGTGAMSLGRFLRRSGRVELLVAGGLAAGREIPVEEDTVTNVDALAAADLSVFAYDYPTMRIDLAVLVFPSLNDPGRVRVNLNGKFKRELFRDFYFSISGYNAFDNRPRGADAEQNDVGASLSFGWSF